MLYGDEEISPQTVDLVFDDLRKIFRDGLGNGNLAVLVDSSGGNVDAAYNLAMLFRQYGSKNLKYIVPRRAKSAATLLVCGGDSIMMTPIAELGPLDPQITQVNFLDRRREHFSPLHIESTLNLIRNEFENGDDELAQGLLERLQFPMTLGNFTKSLELGMQYAERLLSSRMLKDEPELAAKTAQRLVEDYAAHSYCINIDEATDLGLVAEELPDPQLRIVWEIYNTTKKLNQLERQERRERWRRRETGERERMERRRRRRRRIRRRNRLTLGPPEILVNEPGTVTRPDGEHDD